MHFAIDIQSGSVGSLFEGTKKGKEEVRSAYLDQVKNYKKLNRFCSHVLLMFLPKLVMPEILHNYRKFQRIR